jgi:hypothetical protein
MHTIALIHSIRLRLFHYFLVARRHGLTSFASYVHVVRRAARAVGANQPEHMHTRTDTVRIDHTAHTPKLALITRIRTHARIHADRQTPQHPKLLFRRVHGRSLMPSN